MIVFSFWPDVIMIKEIGDPMTGGRISEAGPQGAQGPRHHGPGAAEHQLRHQPVRLPPLFHPGLLHHDQRREHGLRADPEYLMSRPSRLYGLPVRLRGFHPHPALHRAASWDWGPGGLQACHHAAAGRRAWPAPGRAFLKHLKQSCRRLIIDGPNCVIGCLPDHTLFMVQDRKKLRPAWWAASRGSSPFRFGDLRPGRRHPGSRQKQGFSTHASGHGHCRPGSPGG
jgi:hypothetical protein